MNGLSQKPSARRRGNPQAGRLRYGSAAVLGGGCFRTGTCASYASSAGASAQAPVIGETPMELAGGTPTLRCGAAVLGCGCFRTGICAKGRLRYGSERALPSGNF